MKVLLVVAAVALAALIGCGRPAQSSPGTLSPPSASSEAAPGVSLVVSIDRSSFVAGSEQIAVVRLESSSDSSVTVFGLQGLRVFDSDGHSSQSPTPKSSIRCLLS
jgi:hypothetical protein